MKLAGEANERAGKANERAATNELARWELEKMVVELRLKLQPRTITAVHVTNFVFLTADLPKIPITIRIGPSSVETESFAAQFREMLTKAGYATNSNADGWGITRTPGMIARRTSSRESASVICAVHGTNQTYYVRGLAGIVTNNFARPIVSTSEARENYVAICLILNQIGIDTEFYASEELKPEHAEFMIVPRR